MTTKISYVSDLHLDTGGYCATPAPCDVLIIAGDTTPIVKLAYAQSNPEWQEQALAIHGWLRRACAAAKTVIFIMGNHEHDHGLFNYTADICRKVLSVYPNVVFLNNQVVELENYVVYGGTGWTNFNNGNAVAMVTAQMYMTDYNSIHVMQDDETTRLLEPRDTLAEHQLWLSGLEAAKEFAAACGKGLIVVTHHCPSRKSSNEARFGRGPENYAFFSELEAQFGAQIPVWIHGHTHDSYDYVHLGTRVVCNPRGYGYTKASLNHNFDPYKTIELP